MNITIGKYKLSSS